MRRLSERWLVVALIFVTGAYAVAEDITLTTYYPSPRGVYREVQWGTNAAARLSADQGASIELRGTGIPYIDFSNDAATDFDMRFILNSDDSMTLAGGNLGIGTGAPTAPLHVSGNAGVLNLEGTDHAYIQWYPDTAAGGRKAYIGFASAGDDNLTIADEIAGASVVISPSLTLGGVARSTWPASPTINTFTGGHDNANYTGYGLTNVTQMEWVKCSFRNGGGFGNVFWGATTSGPVGYHCHARRYPGNGRWVIGIFCPANWKLISGGGRGYQGTVGDFTPDNILYGFPDTYEGFTQIPHDATPAADAGSGPANPDEGWVFGVTNSGGFDAGIGWALCGH